MDNTGKHKTIHTDEADRGLCYYCGKPSEFKVGLWSLDSENAKQSWRAILICKGCNNKHKWVDERELPDTYLGY